MGLFENRKANAMAELERDLRKLEEMGKPTTDEANLQYLTTNGNIEFCVRAQLISQQQAQEMFRRLREAQATEREREMYKKEYADDRVDSFENPRERTKRYQTMERINAEIAQERAQSSTDRVNQQSTPQRQAQNKSEDAEKTRA